jgi:hypothetical protein
MDLLVFVAFGLVTICGFCGLGFALGYVVGRKQHEG